MIVSMREQTTREEAMAKSELEIVVAMLRVKVNIALIAKVSKFSENEILQLKEEYLV